MELEANPRFSKLLSNMFSSKKDHFLLTVYLFSYKFWTIFISCVVPTWIWSLNFNTEDFKPAFPRQLSFLLCWFWTKCDHFWNRESPKLTVILFCSWNYLSSGWRRATAQGKLLHLGANALCWELKIRNEWIPVINDWTTTGGLRIISSLKAERNRLNNRWYRWQTSLFWT